MGFESTGVRVFFAFSMFVCSWFNHERHERKDFRWTVGRSDGTPRLSGAISVAGRDRWSRINAFRRRSVHALPSREKLPSTGILGSEKSEPDTAFTVATTVSTCQNSSEIRARTLRFDRDGNRSQSRCAGGPSFSQSHIAKTGTCFPWKHLELKRSGLTRIEDCKTFFYEIFPEFIFRREDLTDVRG